jgi:hypothetical protein
LIAGTDSRKWHKIPFVFAAAILLGRPNGQLLFGRLGLLIRPESCKLLSNGYGGLATGKPPLSKGVQMKKAFVISLAVMLCLSAIALAADNDKSMSKSLQGTITRVDTASKTLVVRETSGTETTVYWDDTTRVVGDLKEGSSVQLTTTERDGKSFASSINAKAASKPY